MPFQFYAGFFRGTLPGRKSGLLLYPTLVKVRDDPIIGTDILASQARSPKIPRISIYPARNTLEDIWQRQYSSINSGLSQLAERGSSPTKPEGKVVQFQKQIPHSHPGLGAAGERGWSPMTTNNSPVIQHPIKYNFRREIFSEPHTRVSGTSWLHFQLIYNSTLILSNLQLNSNPKYLTT